MTEQEIEQYFRQIAHSVSTGDWRQAAIYLAAHNAYPDDLEGRIRDWERRQEAFREGRTESALGRGEGS